VGVLRGKGGDMEGRLTAFKRGLAALVDAEVGG
jgi:hypothetical protein